jgi:hypothetical protein
MKRIIKKGISFWEGEVSFGMFLLMVVISNFVMMPLSATYRAGGMLAAIFWFFLVVTGAYVIIKRNILRYGVIGFVLMTLILFIYGWGREMLWLDIVERISQIIFLFIFSGLILVKVFEGGVVNKRRILGAIVAYLMLGNIFFSAYYLIYLAEGPGAFSMQEGDIASQFMYYSYVTLTSTGYGDILPVSSAARSICNLESIMGQLYPAILIARLISLETAAKSNDNSNITPNE